MSFLPRDAAVRIAHESNDYAKRLTVDHPDRFGMFAMLPMPHIDESLKAIEYALDVLKANGIGMMTSYGDKWLGYKEFTPVFDELNRRKATVYTHPTAEHVAGLAKTFQRPTLDAIERDNAARILPNLTPA